MFGYATRRLGCGLLVAVAALVVAPEAGAAGWRLVPIAGLGSGSIRLSGVSCTAANACTVVGDHVTASGDVGLAARWNGSRWALESTPAPGGATNFAFNSVACTSASRCVAAGQDGYDRAGDAAPFAASWTGSGWTAGALTWDNGDFSDSTAMSLACLASDDCFAVGFDTDEIGGGGNDTGVGDEQGETWRWNGSRWSGGNTSATGGDGDETVNTWNSAVACHGPSFCMEAGGSGPSYDNPVGDFLHADNLSLTTDGSTPGALIINGHGSGAGSAISGNAMTSINALACGSTTACEVVGDTNGLPPAFADGWNGTKWSVQSLPDAGAANLGALSCPSSRRCIAGGTIGNRVLVDVWNGARWAPQAAPTPTGTRLLATGAVSCPTTRACLLVGYYSNAAGVHVPFAERYS